jgi:hypothetical protein
MVAAADNRPIEKASYGADDKQKLRLYVIFPEVPFCSKFKECDSLFL